MTNKIYFRVLRVLKVGTTRRGKMVENFSSPFFQRDLRNIFYIIIYLPLQKIVTEYKNKDNCLFIEIKKDIPNISAKKALMLGNIPLF